MTFGLGIEDFFKRYQQLKAEEAKISPLADIQKKDQEDNVSDKNQDIK